MSTIYHMATRGPFFKAAALVSSLWLASLYLLSQQGYLVLRFGGAQPRKEVAEPAKTASGTKPGSVEPHAARSSEPSLGPFTVVDGTVPLKDVAAQDVTLLGRKLHVDAVTIADEEAAKLIAGKQDRSPPDTGVSRDTLLHSTPPPPPAPTTVVWRERSTFFLSSKAGVIAPKIAELPFPVELLRIEAEKTTATAASALPEPAYQAPPNEAPTPVTPLPPTEVDPEVVLRNKFRESLMMGTKSGIVAPPSFVGAPTVGKLPTQTKASSTPPPVFTPLPYASAIVVPSLSSSSTESEAPAQPSPPIADQISKLITFYSSQVYTGLTTINGLRFEPQIPPSPATQQILDRMTPSEPPPGVPPLVLSDLEARAKQESRFADKALEAEWPEPNYRISVISSVFNSAPPAEWSPDSQKVLDHRMPLPPAHLVASSSISQRDRSDDENREFADAVLELSSNPVQPVVMTIAGLPVASPPTVRQLLDSMIPPSHQVPQLPLAPNDAPAEQEPEVDDAVAERAPPSTGINVSDDESASLPPLERTPELQQILDRLQASSDRYQESPLAEPPLPKTRRADRPKSTTQFADAALEARRSRSSVYYGYYGAWGFHHRSSQWTRSREVQAILDQTYRTPRSQPVPPLPSLEETRPPSVSPLQPFTTPPTIRASVLHQPGWPNLLLD